MKRNTGQRAHHLLSRMAVPVMISFFLPGVTAFLPAQDVDARVEMSCRIIRPSGRPDRQVWRVEFRKPDGELLSEELRNTGDRIRIRNLKPGIYTLCLYGDRGRQRCESLDLTPPAGRRTTKFDLRFEVPEQTANHSDDFLVSSRRLSVPRQAQQEMLRSGEAQRRGDSLEAVRHLERALQIYPDYPDALNNLGVQMRRSKNFKKAIGLLVRLTRIEPEYYPGWINLGGSLLAVGRFSEALEANLRAQKLRSDDASANSQLAVNYYYLRDYAEAAKYFKRVHEIDPLNASSPQLFLAQIALSQKRSSEAQDYIRSHLELHPNSPQAPRLRQMLSSLETRGSVSPREGNLTLGP